MIFRFLTFIMMLSAAGAGFIFILMPMIRKTTDKLAIGYLADDAKGDIKKAVATRAIEKARQKWGLKQEEYSNRDVAKILRDDEERLNTVLTEILQ